MRDNRRGAEITVQSMPYALEYRNCVLHMWTPYERWYYRKQEVHLIHAGFVLHPELLHKEGPATRSQVWESTWMQRVPYGKSTSKEMPQEEIWQHPRPIHPRQDLQENDDWVGTLWRDHPWDGSACKRKPQSYCHQSRNWRIPWQLVDSLECGEFRYDAHKASTWLQESIVDIVPPQESGGQEALWKVVTKFLLMVAMANKLVGTRLWEFTTKMEWPLIERRNLCIRWATICLRYESQQELNAKFIVNISVTADSSLLSPTGSVNTTLPDTAIHEQMAMTNGYVKVCTTTSTPSNIGETIVDNNMNDATHEDLHKMQHWALHAVP